MNHSVLLPLCAASMLLTAAPGASATSADDIDTLVVTPTLTERRLAESDFSLSVIDADMLVRQQPLELADILRGRPGIDVTTNGAYGKVTSLFVRGTSASQSLLLIDGVRMGSATGGAPSWQYVPPQLIDRVEVLRGPRSVVYGADAIGGVVQTFTQRGTEGRSVSASAGVGSFSGRDVALGFDNVTERSALGVAFNHFETDGTPLRPGGDRKGYDNTSFFLRARTQLAGDIELGATALRSQGNTEFIGGETDFVHQSVGLRAAMPVGESWNLSLDFSEGRDESDNFQSFGDSVFDTRMRTWRAMGTWSAGEHEMVIGADYRDDVVTSTTQYDESSRDNRGVFVQGLVRVGDLDIQPALRWDDNEAYGREWTTGLTLGHPLGDSHRLRAGYGTAFRAPTFNDLYFPGFGNPDVGAETSRSVEVGITGRQAQWYWDLVAYQTDVDDLIAFRFIDGRFAAFNVEEARIRGAEFSTGIAVSDWVFSAAYSHTNPVNRDTGLRLPRRTRDSLRLEADRQLGAFSLGVTSIVQGHRYDNAAATERLAGFGLVNLRAGWRFSDLWSLRVSVDNALDRAYSTARDSFNGFDFQQPGRSVFVRLRYGER
ncbi:MAG: TonB-dependent receptor [Gammaproteobacteria bacterium]|nr:TonB-dependent receptor [Gammaproteobacteria bacterium]